MTIENLIDSIMQAFSSRDLLQAKSLINSGIEQFPNTITLYVLLDRLYSYNNKSVSEKERLLGRLTAFDAMLRLDPKEEANYQPANYASGIRYERATILVSLAQELLDVNILKQAMEAFDQCPKNYWNTNARLASWQMLVRVFDSNVLTTEFGDIAELQLQYHDDVIVTEGNKAADDIADKGKFLAQLGRYQEAIQTHRQSLKVNKTKYLAYLDIAECQIELGEFQKALEACEKVPQDYQYAYDKPLIEARAFARLGRSSEALQKLNDFGIQKRDVGVKAPIRAHRDFMSLWENDDFLEMTFATNLGLDFVEKLRNKIRDSLI